MPEEWNQKRLDQMIRDKVEESLTLDYKRARALHKEKKVDIAKDVSAMANSVGGLIIYGVAEVGHEPDKIDPVKRSEYSREWLEQVINSNIQPRIDGIVIHPVVINNSDEDVVYVVEIPQSKTAHQNVKELRYYKRYNFESIAMHDYEIRDVMNRNEKPQLNVQVFVQEVASANGYDGYRNYRIMVEVKNLGIKVIPNYKLALFLPDINTFRPEYEVDNGAPYKLTMPSEFDTRVREISERSQVAYLAYHLVHRSEQNLYPKDTARLFDDTEIVYHIQNVQGLVELYGVCSKLDIRWKLFADQIDPLEEHLPLVNVINSSR